MGEEFDTLLLNAFSKVWLNMPLEVHKLDLGNGQTVAESNASTQIVR